MNNSNLSNLENIIKGLNDQMRKDTQELDKNHRELAQIEENDRKSEEEIKLKTKQIEDFKLQIRTAEVKLSSNKALHNKLKAEIGAATVRHNKNLADLTHSQQEYTQSLKQSGVKVEKPRF